jgi:hypothetical protein
MFSVIAKIIPKKLKTRGMFLIAKGKNSISVEVLYKIVLKIEFPKKLLPKPTNKSFRKNPEKILPIDKIKREKPIFLGSSCIF